jgi:hypothetical protein
MEASILTSTKKVLSIAPSYTVFDMDIIMHINAAFAVLHGLGVGPAEGFAIEDSSAEWEEFEPVAPGQSHLVRTYVFLKAKSLFDPPGTSFHLTALNEQLREYEWRLNVGRENELPEEVVA